MAGVALFSVKCPAILETNLGNKDCTIQDLIVNSSDDLTRMKVFAALLQCIQKHCVVDNIGHLGMPIPQSSKWFTKFLGPGGFQLCKCLRLSHSGDSVQLCVSVSGPPKGFTESHLSPRSVAGSPHQTAITGHTFNESRGSAGSGSIKEARGVQISTQKARQQTLGAQSKESSRLENLGPSSNAGRLSAVGDQRPSRPSPQGWPDNTQERLQEKLSSAPIDDDPMQTYLDNLVARPEVSPPHSQTTSLQGIRGRKEYCMHWIKTGECNYMQQGCKYKHEIPADQATRLRIGLRKTPEWVYESSDYQQYIERPTPQASGPPSENTARSRRGSLPRFSPRKRRYSGGV